MAGLRSKRAARLAGLKGYLRSGLFDLLRGCAFGFFHMQASFIESCGAFLLQFAITFGSRAAYSGFVIGEPRGVSIGSGARFDFCAVGEGFAFVQYPADGFEQQAIHQEDEEDEENEYDDERAVRVYVCSALRQGEQAYGQQSFVPLCEKSTADSSHRN
jgi:hypothetical protein